jgi:uncharacterized protein (TIGR02266 family)
VPEEGKDFVTLRANRRKNLRKQILVLKVKGSGSRGAFFGYAKTISKGGMFIASVNPRKVGEEFEINFELPGTKEKATCRCKVAWMREYDPGSIRYEPGMGITFIDLAEDKRTKIDEWVKNGNG